MNRTLPLCPPPYPDEPFLGFLQRVCHESAIPDVRTLRRISGLPGQASGRRPAFLGGLAELIGVPEWDLDAMIYGSTKDGATFFGLAVWDQLIAADQRRVCPRCLAQDGYHRAFWDLSVVTVCPFHNAPLLARCWKCRELLSWDSGSPMRCQCGKDCREMKAVTGRTSPATRLLWAKWRQQQVECPNLLGGLNLSETATTLYHLGWYLRGYIEKPRPKKHRKNGTNTSSVMDEGYEGVSNWPVCFHMRMHHALSRPRRLSWSKSAWLTSISHWIESPLMPHSIRASFGHEMARYI